MNTTKFRHIRNAQNRIVATVATQMMTEDQFAVGMTAVGRREKHVSRERGRAIAEARMTQAANNKFREHTHRDTAFVCTKAGLISFLLALKHEAKEQGYIKLTHD